MKTPLFPCKYYQKGGFSMAMLVFGVANNDGLEKIYGWLVIVD